MSTIVVVFHWWYLPILCFIIPLICIWIRRRYGVYDITLRLFLWYIVLWVFGVSFIIGYLFGSAINN